MKEKEPKVSEFMSVRASVSACVRASVCVCACECVRECEAESNRGKVVVQGEERDCNSECHRR